MMCKFCQTEATTAICVGCGATNGPFVSPACYDATKEGAVDMLIAVARAAYFLADDTCEEGGILTVPQDSFDKLSAALDVLDELPEPGPNIYGTGPAKAEALLAP